MPPVNSLLGEREQSCDEDEGCQSSFDYSSIRRARGVGNTESAKGRGGVGLERSREGEVWCGNKNGMDRDYTRTEAMA